MKRRNILAYALSLTALTAVSTAATAMPRQDVIVVEPLFEYPVAPDDIEGLTPKSEWLLEHFWDAFDLKKDRQTVDQNALNDAFSVYVAPMRFADADKTDASVTRLIQSISKNPALTLQFAKAAEEALYGPRAEIWNGDILLRFVDNMLACKGVRKERKARYERLRTLLGNTRRGSVPPEFDYTTPEGKISHYSPNGVITVIEFGDPDCDDCRHAKLKMDTDIRFSSLVDRGKVNVLFINVDPAEGWQSKLSGYPAKWYVGASDEVGDLYDLRETPSIYVIDREGRVAAKNVDVNTAMQIASAAAEQ